MVEEEASVKSGSKRFRLRTSAAASNTRSTGPALAESAKNVSSSSSSKKANKSSFRRMRGIVTGESRRAKRKAAKDAAQAQGLEVTSMASELDTDSVYGVEFDSKPNSPSRLLLDLAASEDEKEYSTEDIQPKSMEPLPVVLLLMDPKSRRFELLQLEFDSTKAIVSDILEQITLSSTEEAFRQMTFTGICDSTGLELIKSLLVSDFVVGNGVLIAIPEGLNAKETARLAQPILGNNRVSKMLRTTGVMEPAYNAPTKAKSHVTRDTSPFLSPGVTLLTVAMVLCMIAVLLQSVHLHLSTPLGPGEALKPGSSRSQCGLLSFFPFACMNASLEMSDNGVLTLFGADQAVEWKIVGGVCKSGKNPNCIEGLVVTKNGDLEIGGKSVTSVMVLGDAPMAPWPFVENPSLRVIRGQP